MAKKTKTHKAAKSPRKTHKLKTVKKAAEKKRQIKKTGKKTSKTAKSTASKKLKKKKTGVTPRMKKQAKKPANRQAAITPQKQLKKTGAKPSVTTKKKAAKERKQPKTTRIAKRKKGSAQTAERRERLSKLIALHNKTNSHVATAKTTRSTTVKQRGKKREEEKILKPKKIRFKKTELDSLRQTLIEEKERIMEQLRQLERLSATDGSFRTADEIPHHSIHIAEFASDNQAIDAALGLRNMKEDQLAEIIEALDKIDKGEFGICESCGSAIDFERLLVLPSAKFCLQCKRKIEMGGGY